MSARPDQHQIDAVYRRADEADRLDTENERLCERVADLADRMLALAVFNRLTCQCGHSAGCENPIAALVLCEQDDGSPDSWLMCRSCVDCAKVGGVMPETTTIYWRDGAEA